MKKIPQAPNIDGARLRQDELDGIYSGIMASLEQAEANIRFAAVSARGCAEERSAERAGSAPSTNRGGKYLNGYQMGSDGCPIIAAQLVLEDGKALEIPARRTWGGSEAFLDWVNFTTDETDFFFGMDCVTDDQVMDRVSFKCEEIFGFGITSQRDTGANFYHRSYILGDGYGVVCHGGQRSTVLVMLSGEGCCAAKEGWENRLYEFLVNRCGGRAKLTRIDLAHDDYSGTRYTVDKADQDFDSGLFNSGGRMPNHEYRGNWKRPNGKGRTLYVGNRKNGKFCRVYEKGRQLGDKNSEWVRIEVEFKSVDRQIPFEALLHPGQYLAAAYPAFHWIDQHQERILTVKKKTEITYQAMVAWLKKQVGPALNVMAVIEGSAEKVLELIRRDEIPARLKLPMWQSVGECIHEYKRVQHNKDVFDSMALA